MEINSGLPRVVEPLRLRKTSCVEKLEQATLDYGQRLTPAQIARYQKFYDRTITDVDAIREGRLPCLKED